MSRLHMWMVVVAVALAGAAARGDDDAGQAREGGAPAPAVERSGLTRASFVLCPALEPHHRELAKIVGFEVNARGPFAVMGHECTVRAASVGHARVTLVSAGMTLAMHLGAFDGAVSPVPELGPDARFVDAQLQPHVLFTMGPLVIDVDAESLQKPSRDTMIALATRVRDILTEANR